VCNKPGSASISIGTICTGYDFSTGTSQANNCGFGDMYTLFQNNVYAFWGNNTGQQGLIDVGVTSGPLQLVPIPASGYNRFGVAAVAGHTYVLPAVMSEPGYYIVFRVSSLNTTTNIVAFDYAYLKH
jgi:hypothetical protein